jgi:hypothetical protein
MRGAALLETCPDPGTADIVRALSPNLCRCGCYARVRRAAERASWLARTSDNGAKGRQDAESREDAERQKGACADGASVERLEFPRPRRPWDMCRPEEREWAELLGHGLVVVAPTQLRTGGNRWSPPGRLVAARRPLRARNRLQRQRWTWARTTLRPSVSW